MGRTIDIETRNIGNMVGSNRFKSGLLSCIVVNYRTPNDLERFLKSFDTYAPKFTKLAVVNVAPNSEDRKVWEKYSHHDYTEFQFNVGYATAVNEESTLTDGDTLAIFNADTMITEGLLESCYGALWSNREWAILGPRQYDEKGRITHAGIFGTLDSPAHRGWLQKDIGQFNDVKEAVTVSGAAYFIKRKVWDELTNCPLYQEAVESYTKMKPSGAFLPTKHYYDETFSSYHAQSHGYKVIYYGLVGMIHSWHRASPLGGFAEKEMPISREFFRAVCDHHGISHD